MDGPIRLEVEECKSNEMMIDFKNDLFMQALPGSEMNLRGDKSQH
jgi:hypothetical protein